MKNSPTSTRPVTRDTAAQLFRRAKAKPVTLGHRHLDKVLNGGLKANESLLLCGPSCSGKTEMLYSIMSQQLCNGGVVDFVMAPGSAPFNVQRFLCVLESCFCRIFSLSKGSRPMGYEEVVAAVGGAASFMERLEQFAENLTVHHCVSAPDFTLALEQLVVSAAPAAEGKISLCTPLVVLDGLGSTSCFVSSLERIAHGYFPLRSFLEKLGVERHCALIVAETTADSAVYAGGQSISSSLEDCTVIFTFVAVLSVDFVGGLAPIPPPKIGEPLKLSSMAKHLLTVSRCHSPRSSVVTLTDTAAVLPFMIGVDGFLALCI